MTLTERLIAPNATEVAIKALAKKIYLLRMQQSPDKTDWLQAELIIALASLLKMLTALPLAFQSSNNAYSEYDGENSAILEIQTKLSVVRTIENALDCSILCHGVQSVLEPKSFEQDLKLGEHNETFSFDEDAQMRRLGTVLGPVGYLVEEDGTPRLEMFTPKWKHVADQINDAITIGEAFLDQTGVPRLARELDILPFAIDTLSEGELSLVPSLDFCI